MALENISTGAGLLGMAAAVAVAGSAIGAALAEKEIGAAAIGAMAEKEELFGKGLLLTVIPETLVIFGLVVAILILQLVQ
ncbi:MAG: V-type ATP synthase subunit K [Candidatus Woesearchaeota archaeon]|nr:V-type ATP synthase subunit K [Candidatus Woesearchaeota archaeon]